MTYIVKQEENHAVQMDDVAEYIVQRLKLLDTVDPAREKLIDEINKGLFGAHIRIVCPPFVDEVCFSYEKACAIIGRSMPQLRAILGQASEEGTRVTYEKKVYTILFGTQRTVAKERDVEATLRTYKEVQSFTVTNTENKVTTCIGWAEVSSVVGLSPPVLQQRLKYENPYKMPDGTTVMKDGAPLKNIKDSGMSARFLAHRRGYPDTEVFGWPALSDWLFKHMYIDISVKNLQNRINAGQGKWSPPSEDSEWLVTVEKPDWRTGGFDRAQRKKNTGFNPQPK